MDVAEAITQIANGKRFSELGPLTVLTHEPIDRALVSGACLACTSTGTYLEMKMLREYVASVYSAACEA